jgi:hypothetical protein
VVSGVAVGDVDGLGLLVALACLCHGLMVCVGLLFRVVAVQMEATVLKVKESGHEGTSN